MNFKRLEEIATTTTVGAAPAGMFFMLNFFFPLAEFLGEFIFLFTYILLFFCGEVWAMRVLWFNQK